MSRYMNVICFCAFVDFFAASMIVTLFLSYLKNELHFSATASGFIESIYGLVQLFSGPIIGAEADLRGLRFTLFWSILLSGISYAFLISKTIWLIALGRFMAGSFKHTQNLLKSAMTIAVEPHELVKAFGRLNAMGSAGFIIGPAIGGFVAHHVSYEAVFALAAVLFVINGLVIFFCFQEPIREQKQLKIVSVWADIKEIDYHKHWDMFAIQFFLSTAEQSVRNNLAWFLFHEYGVNERCIGYLGSYQGLISFIASLNAAKIIRCFRRETDLFILLLLVQALILYAMFTANSLLTYTIYLGFLCIGISLIRPISNHLIAKRTETKDIGLITCVSASCVAAARTISPILAGSMHDWSMRSPSGLSSGSMLICFGIATRFTRQRRRHISEKVEKCE